MNEAVFTAGYDRTPLSPEQMAEFPTPELAAFAAAWLDFQRSSPCTTEKRSFAYFTAPGQDAMAEPDILYGPDREQAYKKLMWSFRRCQRMGLLDRYFDAAHNQYYESKTIKGLVLLKEWSIESVAKPGLYTGSFRRIVPEDYDQIWLIVRGLKAMPKNPLGNICHVPLLSPSKGLWYHYLDLKKAGKWDRRAFMMDYAPKFLEEMLKPEPRAKLEELRELAKSQAILCACYCTDENLCHRSLVKAIYQTMRG